MAIALSYPILFARQIRDIKPTYTGSYKTDNVETGNTNFGGLSFYYTIYLPKTRIELLIDIVLLSIFLYPRAHPQSKQINEFDSYMVMYYTVVNFSCDGHAM